jgi:hypothetical protein
MRLRCEIFRKGKAIPGKVFDILNEVVVDRGSNPYLSKIECYEHDHLITKVSVNLCFLIHTFQVFDMHVSYSMMKQLILKFHISKQLYMMQCYTFYMTDVMSFRYKVMESLLELLREVLHILRLLEVPW